MENERRRPVATRADLETLDSGDIVEGYLDGLNNEPCGDNRSRSFWHGWRNGMVDGKHAEGDYEQACLAQDLVQSGYFKGLKLP